MWSHHYVLFSDLFKQWRVPNGVSNSTLYAGHKEADLRISQRLSYSPENAEVQLTAEIRNEKIVLEVRNASADLRPEDIVHMKDRFWRRHKTHAGSGHSGLGLTLVDALARILQLEVSLQLDSQQVFRVRISGLQAALHKPG